MAGAAPVDTRLGGAGAAAIGGGVAAAEATGERGLLSSTVSSLTLFSSQAIALAFEEISTFAGSGGGFGGAGGGASGAGAVGDGPPSGRSLARGLLITGDGGFGGGGGGGGGGAVALIEAREKKEPRDAWRPPFTPASAHQGGSWQYFSISASDGGTVPTFFCTIPRKASDCFGMPGWLIE